MRFDTAQQMRLSQQMKLAPRMIQSMEILQLPALALQERIEQELESNVALEIIEPAPAEADGETGAAENERDESIDEERLDRRELIVSEENGGSAADFQRLSVFESSYDGDAFENSYSSERYSPPRQSGERDRKMDAMANIAARGEGLVEQLLHQWTFAEVDPVIADVGRIIIGYINNDGLLGADLETILDQNRHVETSKRPNVQTSKEGGDDASNPDVEGTAFATSGRLDVLLLEQALREVQQWLDPPGIAARDLRECLLLQAQHLLQEADPEDREGWSDVRLLIEEHFDDLLQNRLPKIQQKTNLPMDRIGSAISLMRKLNLHPGRDLVQEEVPTIVPDLLVEYDEQSDSYVAALTSGTVPPLRVSPRYATMAKDRTVDKETREYVASNVRSATWLIESINQRKNTLLRVVNVVLARQREYFDHGSQHLKPMPMTEVADQLGVHVATVSRAVADKWMQTPRGLVPLRRFFSGGTQTQSGENVSWEAVKAMLREIVDAEDKCQPLSDEAIAEHVRKRGVEIARRTVVKYRQQLNIPPARRRKVY